MFDEAAIVQHGEADTRTRPIIALFPEAAKKSPNTMLGYFVLLLCLSLVSGEGKKTGSSETVGCFTCNSYNNSDPGCKDPFNPEYSVYTSKCKVGMRDRVGEFPAHYCIKMSGFSIDGGVEVTVRTCALKSMHHQCGIFEFDEKQYRGCLMTCERNGCNYGNRVAPSPFWSKLITSCLCIVTLSGLRVSQYLGT